MDVETVRAEWARRGFSFGIWRDPPGQVWSNFEHDVDELVMLVDGQMTLSLAGRRSALTAGVEILIPATTNHTVHNTGQQANCWYYGYRLKGVGTL